MCPALHSNITATVSFKWRGGGGGGGGGGGEVMVVVVVVGKICYVNCVRHVVCMRYV